MDDHQARALASPEYRAALEAQIDFDSTRTGQRELQAAMEVTPDTRGRALLRGRYHAGVAAHRFRREQAALMPPGRAPSRRDEAYRPHADLAQAREDLARQLGWAAAEGGAFGECTPATRVEVCRRAETVLAADRRRRGDAFVGAIHPAEVAASPGMRAPWAAGEYRVPAVLGDIGVLVMLGVAGRWVTEDGEDRLTAAGDTDAAVRWGYVVARGPDGRGVVTHAPDIVTFVARGGLTPAAA